MLQLKSLNSQLIDLRFAFDHAIMKGDSFAEVKKIYIQIKDVERLIAEREAQLLRDGREG